MSNATQWFKNGDHPLDYANEYVGIENGELREFSGEERKARDWEGDVVRRYRHPYTKGSSVCAHCLHTMHNHGWIDSGAHGRVVCPGDWIVTANGAHFPLKPDVFKAVVEKKPMTNSAEFPSSTSATPPEGWSPKAVIELLEAILAEAKANRYVCVGIATVNPNGAIASAFATTNTPHNHHLTAAALYLLRRAEKNAGMGD
jgi:hypothetical protein